MANIILPQVDILSEINVNLTRLGIGNNRVYSDYILKDSTGLYLIPKESE